MNRNEPERSPDSIHAQELAQERGVAAKASSTAKTEAARHHAKQLSAVIWIIAAWLVGTLISELNVIGAEVQPQSESVGTLDHSSKPGAGTFSGVATPSAVGVQSIRRKSLFQKLQSQETEFGIAHSGIEEFDRISRNHHMRHLLDSMIAQETRKQALAITKQAGVNRGSSNPETAIKNPEKASTANPAAIVAQETVEKSSPVDAVAANEISEASTSKSAANTPRSTSKRPSTSDNPKISRDRSAESTSTANQVATAVKTSTPVVRKSPTPAVEIAPDNSASPDTAAIAKAESTASSSTALSEAAVAQKTNNKPPHSVSGLEHSDTHVDVAYEHADSELIDGPVSSKTELAWKGFPTDSLPGIVNLVVHSFNELMSPVHVRPLASDDSMVAVPNHSSQADGSVAFVEAVTGVAVKDDSISQKVSSAAPSASPVDTQTSISSDQALIAEEESAASPTESRTPFQPAEIVRFRPLLLEVPDTTTMIPARHAESAENGEMKLAEASPSQEPTRLAAKWPFERSPTSKSSMVTLNVDNADVRTVFEMLARGYEMNILVSPEVEGVVTANVDGLTPGQTLEGIVKMCNLNMQQDENLIYIYSADQLPADAKQLRVFPLDFARAATLEATVQGLLSPVGSAYSSTVDTQDNLQTQESIVVLDIPEVIAQVENYILQADQAPRQVLIEARVLEVELTDDMVHGINFGAILGGDLSINSAGLAEPVVGNLNPIFYAQVDGSKVKSLIDLLETTTDAKTLASPRVQVINGQNARIQVGQQLGFTVATVTQTSTIQDIQFLETGVVLSVTPTISRDNRILMEVKPEVSDGEINPDTLLPEEETREVETSVLLDNHQGVVIGGLIQEKDRTVIKKLPWLGDVKHIGKLFQRREAVRSRSEIIVALVPHIIERGIQDERSAIEYERATTPLLQGVLQRTCRPWEPRLPDRAGDERHMDVNRLNKKLP